MFEMFKALKEKKQVLNTNKMIVNAMLKRRKMASRAIVNVVDIPQRIRLVK